MYVLASCCSVCKEGEGEERKWIQIQIFKFKLVKVQCNLQKELPKFGSSNLDVIQLQLEQEERNGFNRMSLAPSSLTYLFMFFSGERTSAWTCMPGCKQLYVLAYPLYTQAQPQGRRCFRAPFPVLLLGSLSQGQLLQELGNECPDFFSLVPHTLKGAPNYIWRWHSRL